MERARAERTWTLVGAALLALTVGVMARRAAQGPGPAAEELRDAVAAPVSPAVLGGARVVRPDAGYFASPAERRAEAEHMLMSSRETQVSKAAVARMARRRLKAERERALAVAAPSRPQ